MRPVLICGPQARPGVVQPTVQLVCHEQDRIFISTPEKPYVECPKLSWRQTSLPKSTDILDKNSWRGFEYGSSAIRLLHMQFLSVTQPLNFWIQLEVVREATSNCVKISGCR